MTISLYRLARSRCLRAMSVLAWLMLVSMSAVASPMNMAAHGEHFARAVHMAVADHCPPDSSAASTLIAHPASPGCCDGHASPSCPCATLCASVTPVMLTQITTVPLSARYDMPARITAPSPNTAPPLRPPSV